LIFSWGWNLLGICHSLSYWSWSCHCFSFLIWFLFVFWVGFPYR
jgi:hypothetical protein